MRIGAALAIGVVLGLFSIVSDRLPYPVSFYGNAVGPWIAGAWAAGALTSGRLGAGVLIGAATLLVAALAYYVGQVVMWPGTLLVGALRVWLVVSLVGGGVFGAAGAAWQAGRTGLRGQRWATAAVALLVGALLAEGVKAQLLEARTLEERLLFAVEPALALALPVLLLDRARRLESYLLALALMVAGALALLAGLPLIRSFIAG